MCCCCVLFWVCFCFESLVTASGRFRSIGDIWPRPLSELDCRKTPLRLEWGLTPQDGDKNGCTIKHIDYTWLDEKLFLFPSIEVEPPLITGSFSTGQIDYGKKMEEGYCVSWGKYLHEMTSEFVGLSCWTALVMQSLRPTPKKRPAVTKPRPPSEKKRLQMQALLPCRKNMVADMAHAEGRGKNGYNQSSKSKMLQ